MKLFDYIQFLSLGPYHRPSVAHITYLVDNLPSNSNMIRLLVSCVADAEPTDFEGQHAQLCRYPITFLASVFEKSMRRQAARNCRKCMCVQEHEPVPDHAMSDVARAWEDPCSFHEHGNDKEEAAQCALIWGQRLAVIQRFKNADKEGIPPFYERKTSGETLQPK